MVGKEFEKEIELDEFSDLKEEEKENGIEYNEEEIKRQVSIFKSMVLSVNRNRIELIKQLELLENKYGLTVKIDEKITFTVCDAFNYLTIKEIYKEKKITY